MEVLAGVNGRQIIITNCGILEDVAEFHKLLKFGVALTEPRDFDNLPHVLVGVAPRHHVAHLECGQMIIVQSWKWMGTKVRQILSFRVCPSHKNAQFRRLWGMQRCWKWQLVDDVITLKQIVHIMS